MDSRILKSKQHVMDFAFDNCNIKTFAELGCTWGMDCAYGLYAHEKYKTDAAYFVDMHWPESSLNAVNAAANTHIVRGNMGDVETVQQIGRVDAVIMFWTLLHQVKPDWNEILQIYSNVADVFVIANPQWIAGDKTVRLFDLGESEYKKNAPAQNEKSWYVDLFQNLDRTAPDYTDGRTVRDAHYVWQWGITNSDLESTMEWLGYKMIYRADNGPFGGFKNYRDFAFVFSKIK